MAKARILIVDDEESPRESLRYILKDRYEVETRENGTAGLAAVRDNGPFDVVLLDMKMPDLNGLQVLEQIMQIAPGTAVVMATAITDAKPAVQAMKLGASDYLNKPFDVAEIRHVVERILREKTENKEAAQWRPEVVNPARFDNIVGDSLPMRKVYNLVDRLCDNDSTVLVLGETGTGKELIARALHFSSCRKANPFIAVHCAAIPSELLESELFGHEKGSFTGAVQRRIGMFEAATGGTLFLDEIGEMPIATQSKLLRAIQEREIRRVGGQETIKINVRLVCATNRNLEMEVKKGTFREDLFYRVNVVPIDLPPLRERKDDVRVLINHFTQRFAKDLNRTVPDYTPEALDLLVNYPWPGNIRELEHAIERVLVICDSNPIGTDNLPFVIANAEVPADGAMTRIPTGIPRAVEVGERLEFDERGHLDLPKLTDNIERRAIEEALRRSDGVMTDAAKALNITRRMLRYKMDKLGVTTGRQLTQEELAEEAAEIAVSREQN